MILALWFSSKEDPPIKLVKLVKLALSGEDVPGTGTAEAEPAGETDEDA